MEALGLTSTSESTSLKRSFSEDSNSKKLWYMSTEPSARMRNKIGRVGSASENQSLTSLTAGVKAALWSDEAKIR